MRKQDWHVIFDEVHGAPADRIETQVLQQLRSKVRLGLSATLIREDDRISELYRHIGPVLCQVGWMELTQLGLLAPVQCMDIRCPMPATWVKAQEKNTCEMYHKIMSALNPTKVAACRAILDRHRRQSVLLFFEELEAMRHYAREMGLAYISGNTPPQMQQQLTQRFRDGTLLRLAYSRTGDTSNDFPRATVGIQISSHYGSRRQEAQRCGRLTRVWKVQGTIHPSTFYTLVSENTKEAMDSTRRQAYLKDQGYTYTTVTREPPAAAPPPPPPTQPAADATRSKKKRDPAAGGGTRKAARKLTLRQRLMGGSH